jgi:capsular exopolysaccharide synthesis family protein
MAALLDPNSTTSEPADADAPGMAMPAALSGAPSVETLWHALRRRWLLVVLLALVGGAAGAAACWALVPATYTVQALLHLGSRSITVLSEPEAEAGNFQRTQATLFTSYPVLHAALEKPEIAQLPEVKGSADAIEWLTRELKTDVLLGPEVLRATLTGDNGDDIALILNEVVRAYLKEVASREEGKVHERIKQLEANYRRHSEKLRDKRQALAARCDELGLDDPETVKAKVEPTLRTLEMLQGQKVKLDLDRKEADVELAAMRLRLAHPETITITDYAILEELEGDVVIQKAYLRLAELDEQVEKLRRISATDPAESSLRGYDAERQTIRERIDAHIRSMRPALEVKLRSKVIAETHDEVAKLERKLHLLIEQEKSLDEQIKTKERQLTTLQRARRPLEGAASNVATLQDEVAGLEQVLLKVGSDLASLQAQLPVPPRVTVLEWAKAPLSMKRDRQIKYAASGGVAFALLMVFGVTLVEFRARRVYTPDDISRGLGMEVLGTLPETPPEGRRVLGGAPLELIEAVDALRARFLHTARQDHVKVLAVASATSGEGKTSLAAHLAASLARGHRRTLLIDADLRNPQAHTHFDLSLTPGFAEGLRGEAAWNDLVQPTPIEGLSLLTAGASDRRAIEALSEDALGAVLEGLKKEYDFVILDTCPILPAADALLIGQHTDGVVFSVLRNVSRLPAVRAAQQRVGALDIPTLGAVVLGDAAQSYGVRRYGK